MSATLPGGSTRVEVRHVRRTLGLGALVWIMFFTVSGGPYGLEDTIGESGAGMGLLLIPAGGDGALGWEAEAPHPRCLRRPCWRSPPEPATTP